MRNAGYSKEPRTEGTASAAEARLKASSRKH